MLIQIYLFILEKISMVFLIDPLDGIVIYYPSLMYISKFLYLFEIQ